MPVPGPGPSHRTCGNRMPISQFHSGRHWRHPVAWLSIGRRESGIAASAGRRGAAAASCFEAATPAQRVYALWLNRAEVGVAWVGRQRPNRRSSSVLVGWSRLGSRLAVGKGGGSRPDRAPRRPAARGGAPSPRRGSGAGSRGARRPEPRSRTRGGGAGPREPSPRESHARARAQVVSLPFVAIAMGARGLSRALALGCQLRTNPLRQRRRCDAVTDPSNLASPEAPPARSNF